eukprot:g1430.t1
MLCRAWCAPRLLTLRPPRSIGQPGPAGFRSCGRRALTAATAAVAARAARQHEVRAMSRMPRPGMETGLVSCEWLKAELDAPSGPLKLVEATWYMPKTVFGPPEGSEGPQAALRASWQGQGLEVLRGIELMEVFSQPDEEADFELFEEDQIPQSEASALHVSFAEGGAWMKCPEGSKESEIDRLSLASTRATPREERTGGSVLRACLALLRAERSARRYAAVDLVPSRRCPVATSAEPHATKESIEKLLKEFQTKVQWKSHRASPSFELLRREFLTKHGPSFCPMLQKALGEVSLWPTPLNTPVQKTFYSSCCGLDGDLIPTFHGTRACSLSSIYQNGLVVPGGKNNVKETSGSKDQHGGRSSINPCSLPDADRRKEAEAQRVEKVPHRRFWSAGLPHMLPDEETFAAAMAALGIEPGTRVVAYDRLGVFSSPRFWYTLKVAFGHPAEVAVLDGGLPRWKELGYPLEEGLPEPSAPAKMCRWSKVPEAVWDKSQVLANIHSKQALHLDARPVGRFHGEQPEPRPKLRWGHVPGSVSLEAVALLKLPYMLNQKDLQLVAKKEGFRARSAFKLLQIDDELKLLEDKTVRNVADLCAAPGGWSQVLALRLVSDERPPPRIVAVDKYDSWLIAGVVQVQGDITHESTVQQVLQHFEGERADLVVCEPWCGYWFSELDGAPDATGRSDFDEYVQHQLLLSELFVAEKLLKEGGVFVAKVFRGSGRFKMPEWKAAQVSTPSRSHTPITSAVGHFCAMGRSQALSPYSCPWCRTSFRDWDLCLKHLSGDNELRKQCCSAHEDRAPDPDEFEGTGSDASEQVLTEFLADPRRRGARHEVAPQRGRSCTLHVQDAGHQVAWGKGEIVLDTTLLPSGKVVWLNPDPKKLDWHWRWRILWRFILVPAVAGPLMRRDETTTTDASSVNATFAANASDMWPLDFLQLGSGVHPCGLRANHRCPTPQRARPRTARIAVYTYNLGGYEEPRAFQVPCAPWTVDAFLFLDDVTLLKAPKAALAHWKHQGWHIKRVALQKGSRHDDQSGQVATVSPRSPRQAIVNAQMVLARLQCRCLQMHAVGDG